MNTYISQLDYLRSPSGLEVASLLGNSLRLSSAVVLGATALPVTPATTVDLRQYDRITIFDGMNSEVVVVNADTNQPVTSIPLQAGTQFAHAAGTPLCSDGPLGSLADQIVDASAWLENITKQVLWSTTQTETLKAPSMRAAIDNRQNLHIRTKQYPITAVSGLVLKANLSNPVSYDPSQAIIDTNELITVPWLTASGGGGSTYSLLPVISRQSNLYVDITYTAGYTTIPGEVRDAVILLVSDILSRRSNPTGADQVQMGKRHIIATLRGDPTGESLLVKRATRMLSNYTVRSF